MTIEERDYYIARIVNDGMVLLDSKMEDMDISELTEIADFNHA